MNSTMLLSSTDGLQETIKLLERELAETNREVLLLTMELDQRVEERTAELRAAQEELRHKNAELLKRTAQLEAANKELESFSYSVSHDLRAPIRHIGAFLQLMLSDQGSILNENARNYISRISKATTLMGKLVDDLLAFSRMGRTEMRCVEFKMDELVNDAIQELSEDTQGRNIEWEIQPLPIVRADRALFRQVWVNLLSNAVKYTGPRDPARIRVRCVEKGDHWEFSVNDNGVGFNMGHAGKLFGVFQRLHSTEEFEGTGIGLANVRQIVSRHNGRTWAEGELGKGATIYFSLPR